MAPIESQRRLGMSAALAALFASLAAALLLVATAPATALADWPSYGHDLSGTRNAGGAGPSPAQAATLQQLWSFTSTQGDITGTPVVAGGEVVVGSRDGTVYALSAATGAVIWSRAVGPQVNGTAAIAGGIVYVPVNIDEDTGSGHPSVVALSLLTGIPLWQTTIDSQPGADVYGSPVVAGGKVYIGASASYAEENLPLVHDRGSVVALNALTGAVVWRTYTVPPGDDGGAVWSTPAIDPATGLLYVGTGNAYHAPAAATTDAVLALDARTGALVASFEATAGDVNQDGSGIDADIGASPNLFTSPSGQQLVGEGDKAGDYWALDRRTLARVWETNVGPGGEIGGILGSTASDGSAIYGPDTQNTETWSLSDGGAPRWTTTASGGYHLGPVAVANGVVYSTDNQGYLVARSTADGSLLTQLPLGAASWGGVSISGGTVFAAAGTPGQTTGYVDAFRPCSAAASVAPGLLSGPVGAIASALDAAGQPALGATVVGLNCALLVHNGL
jgi:polyvinyl alcohol dehydrogenase (cytochrome)